ncbi:hemagglutination domain protein [Campylobacter lari]|uniref:two-partner secretion domain-containing protein n=1 Tax=Campylobacter lari TaxID=201 RepID=UPI000DF10267|nr:filamentous hemagglutinin N-terminal domain-containing protein [Campylobacter lari]STA75181.1 hemagglutination domain protein [Campylobacter lari]
MLFSSSFALPSGGKFTHGTSGSISINGKEMNIAGNKQNSIIQWGGGFNIGKGESVNFGGKSQNYLNIAHGTSKSTIEGLLNANGKNVFLINPNGVIITKTGTINANRFVASTSSMDSRSMQEFADGKLAYNTFSPVFIPQKAGNVVNMGNINANDVLLIGNKVDIQGGKLGNKKSTTHLVGKNVYIDADSTNLNSTINVTATEGGYIQRQMINFAKDKYSFGDNVKINVVNYKDSSGATHIGSSNFKKALTIGNMGNEKDNAIEWWHFAKGWNEDLGDIRNIDEFRLVGNIDFGANCKNGVCSGQNYANFWVDLNGDGVKQDNEFTNMIVGYGDYDYVDDVSYDAFTKSFDGQGYTLKNINIDATKIKKRYELDTIGIFGVVSDSTFKNVNIDYLGGGISIPDSFMSYVGGFIGEARGNNTIDNITLKNISKIHIDSIHDIIVGGFIGRVYVGDFSNIYIENIGDIKGTIPTIAARHFTGGFAGQIYLGGTYSDIVLKNIISLSQYNNFINNAYADTSIGGFAGSVSGGSCKICVQDVNVNNIYADIGKIYIDRHPDRGSVGGFIGRLVSSSGNKYFHNINLEIDEIIGRGGGWRNPNGGFIGAVDIYNNNAVNFKDISIKINKFNFPSSYSGGFIGNISVTNPVIANVNFSNIYMYYNQAPNSQLEGKFFGGLGNGKFTFDNIHIYHHENDLTNATNDQAYWNDFNKNGYVSDKINIHTYNDNTQESAYKDFLSKANTIEKPSKPSKPTDPTDPNDPDVILGSDDVISAKDLNQWLDEIFAGNYWVDIKDLDKIQGLNESIIQSISFLEALYGQEGMKEILEKFHNDYKTAYSKYDKFKNNKAELLAFINDKLKPLVDSSNNALDRLKIIQEQLKTAIAKYNDYVKKVNENPAIKNEETLNALKAQVDKLNQISGELATTIAKNQITLKDWQDKASDDSNGQFTIKGQFDNVALLIPDLEKVTTNGNENDEYQKISRQIANLQKQTPTFEYEEEETEEIEEASMNQKGKTCIVSDNYRTMNPCVVGSF